MSISILASAKINPKIKDYLNISTDEIGKSLDYMDDAYQCLPKVLSSFNNNNDSIKIELDVAKAHDYIFLVSKITFYFVIHGDYGNDINGIVDEIMALMVKHSSLIKLRDLKSRTKSNFVEIGWECQK